jgi:hypothetical protein
MNMRKQINLKEAERMAFRMTFQDGLWDIFLGVVILQFAIVPYLTDLGWGDFWSSMTILPVYFAALYGLRKLKSSLVVPRVGLVNYHQQRKKKIRKITSITIISLFLGLVFGLVLFVGDDFSEWLFPGLFSVVALGAFSGAAYYLDFPRLMAYGVLTALAPLIGQILYKTIGSVHHGFPITFGVSGSLMIVVGLYLLSQFLQKYPLPDASEMETK